MAPSTNQPTNHGEGRKGYNGYMPNNDPNADYEVVRAKHPAPRTPPDDDFLLTLSRNLADSAQRQIEGLRLTRQAMIDCIEALERRIAERERESAGA